MLARMHTHTHTHARMHTHTHTCVRTHTHMHTRPCTQLFKPKCIVKSFSCVHLAARNVCWFFLSSRLYIYGCGWVCVLKEEAR